MVCLFLIASANSIGVADESGNGKPALSKTSQIINDTAKFKLLMLALEGNSPVGFPRGERDKSVKILKSLASKYEIDITKGGFF